MRQITSPNQKKPFPPRQRWSKSLSHKVAETDFSYLPVLGNKEARNPHLLFEVIEAARITTHEQRDRQGKTSCISLPVFVVGRSPNRQFLYYEIGATIQGEEKTLYTGTPNKIAFKELREYRPLEMF